MATIKVGNKTYKSLEQMCAGEDVPVARIKEAMRVGIPPGKAVEAWRAFVALEGAREAAREKDTDVAIEFLHKKLDRAVKRWHEKNSSIKTTQQLSLLESEAMAFFRHYGEMHCVVSAPLSDDSLRFAIAVTLSAYETDAVFDPKEQLAPYLDKHRDIIAILTMFSQSLVELYKAYSANRAQNSMLTLATSGMLEPFKADKAKDEEIARLRKELAQANQRIDEFADTMQKAIAEEQHRHNAELKELQTAHDELQKTYTALQAQSVVQVPEQGDNQPTLYALPSSGVVFVGGHQHVISKLKDLYPGWVYIRGDARTFKLTNTSPEIIFYHPQGLDHTTLNKVSACITGDPPIFYVRSTNITALCNEMVQHYSVYREEKDNGEN